jgi:hypothetical protein
MSIFVPPGYELLSDVYGATYSAAEANALRGHLGVGKRRAFITCNGKLYEISPGDWITELGEAMLECGYYVARGFCRRANGYEWAPVDPSAPKYPIVVAIAEAAGLAEKRVEVDPVEAVDRQSTPKRLTIRKAAATIYGSVEESKSVPVNVRNDAINKWLKDNKRGRADPKTITAALRENSGK